MHGQKMLKAGEVRKLVPWWSAPTLYRNSRNGKFVAPIPMGATLLWPEDEVRTWLRQRFEQRRKAASGQ